MEYLGYKTKIIKKKNFLGGRVNLVIENEQGKIVDSNFKGGEEDFKDSVLIYKYRLYCNQVYDKFLGMFTMKGEKIYLEGDCIGRVTKATHTSFEFNKDISYPLREKLAQKLKKVFKDCRNYQADYENRGQEQEYCIKKEREERILNNLEKWN